MDCARVEIKHDQTHSLQPGFSSIRDKVQLTSRSIRLAVAIFLFTWKHFIRITRQTKNKITQSTLKTKHTVQSVTYPQLTIALIIKINTVGNKTLQNIYQLISSLSWQIIYFSVFLSSFLAECVSPDILCTLEGKILSELYC